MSSNEEINAAKTLEIMKSTQISESMHIDNGNEGDEYGEDTNQVINNNQVFDDGDDEYASDEDAGKGVFNDISKKFKELFTKSVTKSKDDIKYEDIDHDEILKCYDNKKVIDISKVPDLPDEFCGQVYLLIYFLHNGILTWSQMISVLAIQYQCNLGDKLSTNNVDGILFHPKVLFLKNKYENRYRKLFDTELTKFIELDDAMGNIEHKK